MSRAPESTFWRFQPLSVRQIVDAGAGSRDVALAPKLHGGPGMKTIAMVCGLATLVIGCGCDCDPAPDTQRISLSAPYPYSCQMERGQTCFASSKLVGECCKPGLTCVEVDPNSGTGMGTCM
jgi:hypothetical protein